MPAFIRFKNDKLLENPKARRLLAKRIPANDQYEFDRERIRQTVQAIVESGNNSIDTNIEIVETYSMNRYCSAVQLGEYRSVILDFGFLELLADSIAVEFLMTQVQRCMMGWAAEGRLDDYEPNDPGSFSFQGQPYFVTGSMMMRDLASKFVEDIVPDSDRRAKLLAKLLWTFDDKRPNGVFFKHLSDEGTNLTRDNPAYPHTLADQITLTSAFVVCHELCHMTIPREPFEVWEKKDKFGQPTMAKFEALSGISIPNFAGDRFVPAETIKLTLSNAATRERAKREALVDMQAVQMLLRYETSPSTKAVAEDWDVLLANLYSQIALANSLIIFRNHMTAAIRDKNIGSLDGSLARGEALLRNFLLLAYLWNANDEIVGPERGWSFIQRIPPEALLLFRRFLYFQIDITNGVEQGEEGWRAFVESTEVRGVE
jgi:hypothetical protein